MAAAPQTSTGAPPWTLWLKGHPPTPNHRLHPLARAVGVSTPLERVHVRAVLHYTRGPLRDVDNATASLKSCLDGLVAGGLLVDDAPAHLEVALVQEITGWTGVVLEVTPAGSAPDPDRVPRKE